MLSMQGYAGASSPALNEVEVLRMRLHVLNDLLDVRLHALDLLVLVRVER